MKINIAPTKTNLLKSKKTLALTKEGYNLLDEKRRILLAELTSIIDIVDEQQERVDKAIQDAYLVLDKATVSIGRRKLEELSYSVNISHNISLSNRRIMGVTVPVASLDVRDNAPYFSPYDVNLLVDEAITRFRDVMKLLAVLAEKRITLIRLAGEAQKTIRKVKALEKVYLPFYAETVKFIGDRLDEEARDAFALLKLIKKQKMQ
jgi:V/A-type H+-transporting ATPase subunit D